MPRGPDVTLLVKRVTLKSRFVSRSRGEIFSLPSSMGADTILELTNVDRLGGLQGDSSAAPSSRAVVTKRPPRNQMRPLERPTCATSRTCAPRKAADD